MAVNETRSQNADLLIGMMEGSYKMRDKDHGGVIEHPYAMGDDQLPPYYEIVPGSGLAPPIPMFTKMRDGGP